MPAEPAPLPTPADRPQADIVLYDGRCNFCCGQVERLSRWDGGGRLSYLSIHDPLVAERWPDIPHERLLREMCIVERQTVERQTVEKQSIERQSGEGQSVERQADQADQRATPRHWGADAVRYLSRRLPRLWWLAPVMHLPGAMLLARPAYRLVARNRYLIAGKKGSCDSDACALHR